MRTVVLSANIRQHPLWHSLLGDCGPDRPWIAMQLRRVCGERESHLSTLLAHQQF